MTNNALKEFYNTICHCNVPEDIFGVIHGATEKEKLEMLKRTFRSLIKAFPVIAYVDKTEEYHRNEVLRIINTFREEAVKKIKDRTYGDRKTDKNTNVISIIKTKRYVFNIHSHLASGDFSNVYYAKFIGAGGRIEEAAIKVVNQSDNDLLDNEVKVLNQLSHLSLPTLVDTFKTRDRKKYIVMKYIDGFDLVSIREKYINGVPEEHVLWMFDRLLNVIGYIHHNGIIHGNLEPSNILVVPRNHNVIPIDFVFSVLKYDKGRKYKGRNNFSAPEVSKQEDAHPVSDMYSIGKCILYLLGGNVQKKTFSNKNKINVKIKRFLKPFLIEDRNERADDAWKWLQKLIVLRRELFDKRRFIHFEM